MIGSLNFGEILNLSIFIQYVMCVLNILMTLFSRI